MNYVPRGPKKPVNMTLSEDLIREARQLTGNLSETVEALLADYVATEKQRREQFEKRLDRSIELIKAHQDEHGLWGEEFTTL
jgi:antitoxin CcdA